MATRKRIYVGVKTTSGKSTTYERFLAVSTPTEASHGDSYSAVIGPFRSKLGALAMVHYGFHNPHLQVVADAEKVGKKYAQELKGMPDRRTITYWPKPI